MASLANLVIADRETSPTNHTFVPANRENADTVRLREAGTVPAGDSYILLSSKRLADGSYRCKLQIIVPTLATRVADGVTDYLVQRQAYASVELRFAKDSTLQERKNMMGFVSNSCLAANTVVNDPFTKLEGWI